MKKNQENDDQTNQDGGYLRGGGGPYVWGGAEGGRISLRAANTLDFYLGGSYSGVCFKLFF